MLRRFNYTGRKKILQEHVPVALTGAKPLWGFDVNLNELKKYGLPEDARIYVEAYEHAAYMRFDYGTIGNIVTPSPDARVLIEFEGSDAVRFRVKVVDVAHEAQLLAEADGILPLSPEEADQNKLPLLPVRSENIGQEVWRIDFPEGTQDRPTLVVNDHVDDRTAMVRSPVFMSLAWPALLREILVRIVVIEGHFDTDDDGDWRCMWLQFAQRLLPTAEIPSQNPEAIEEWISEVISAFCGKFILLAKFKESEEEANAITS